MNIGTKDFLNRLTSNTDLQRSVQIAQSNEDRLNLVLQHLVEKEIGFLEHFQNVWKTINVKDYNRSLAAKNSANVEFGAKRCHSALLKTNDGLSLAPPGSDLFPVLYGNRSAILFDLKHYQDCLANIELALSGKCPPSLKPKMLFRKAKCLQLLNDSETAEKVYQASLKEIETILTGEIGGVERKQYEDLKKKMEKSWREVSEEKRAQEKLNENGKKSLQERRSEKKGVSRKKCLQKRSSDIQDVSLETNLQDRISENNDNVSQEEPLIQERISENGSRKKRSSKERTPDMKNLPRDKSLLQERVSESDDSSSTPFELSLPSTNPVIPVASKSVTLSHNEHFGRSVTAVQDISPGEIIIVEQPTVSVLRPETLFRLTHCHACLSRCVNSCIPCDTCDVLYCDAECKVRSSKSYHRTECWTLNVVKQMEMFGIVEMLALRFVLQETKQGQDVGALWRKTAHVAAVATKNGEEIPHTATANVNGTPHTGIHSENQNFRDLPSDTEVLREFPSDNEVLRDFPSLVYQLETNEDGREASDRITRAVKAVILCELLRIDGVFQDSIGECSGAQCNPSSSSGCNGVSKIPPSNRSDCGDVTRLSGCALQFASLLVHYFQAVACNAHDVNTFFSSPSGGSADPVQIGGGLYPFCSMVNHACDPNVVRHSQGTTVIVTSLKTIRRGQQLFDNYGVHYATHDRPHRKTYLWSQYRFHCACVACQDNYPLFKPVQEGNLIFRADLVVSPACQSEILNSEESFNEVLAEMMDSFGSGGGGGVANVKKKLSVVIRYMKLLNQYVRGPRQEFEKCQETYKRLMCYVTNCVMLEQGEEAPE
uniref:SET and MYND domain-containing protein 4 n=1 Tax=Cacopsylla melanoneura TaxID=428564 RepID=A0A8D8X1S2_9HEMI